MLKKFLSITIICSLLFLVVPSYAEMYYIGHEQGGKYTISLSQGGTHLSVDKGGASECPACKAAGFPGVQHQSAEFQKDPECNCTFKLNTNYPTGKDYEIVSRGTTIVTHTCGNKGSLRQQAFDCKWEYINVVRKDKPKTEDPNPGDPDPDDPPEEQKKHEHQYELQGSHSCSFPGDRLNSPVPDETKEFEATVSPNIYDDKTVSKHGTQFNLTVKTESRRIGFAGDINIETVGCQGNTLRYVCVSNDGLYCDAPYNGSWSCPATSTIRVQEPPQYVLVNHPAKVEFIGFRVNGNVSNKSMGAFSTSGKVSGVPSLNSETFNLPCVITELVESELEADAATGMLKGKIIASCLDEDGQPHVTKTFPVYFRPVPNTPPDSDPNPDPDGTEHTLTIKSEYDGIVKLGERDKKVGEDSAKYGYGTRVNISVDDITPEVDKEYEFKGWYYNGGVVYPDKSTTIKMPNYDYELIAKFDRKEKTKFTVKVTTIGNGTVQIDDGNSSFTETKEVYKGTTVRLNAYPDSENGFQFDSWWERNSKDGTGTKRTNPSSFDLVVDKDYEFEAMFKGDPSRNYKRLTIQVKYGQETMGYVVGGGSDGNRIEIQAVPGKTYRIEAVPLTYNEFEYWKMTEDGYTGSDSIDSPIYEFVMPQKDVVATAYFFGSDGSIIKVFTDGGGSVQIGESEEPSKWSKVDQYIKDPSVLNVCAFARPDPGYKFVKWEMIKPSTREVSTQKEYSIPQTMILNDKMVVYKAIFEEKDIVDDKYRLTVETEDGGWVEGGGLYPGGTRVTVIAHPYEETGWIFSKWVDENNVEVSKSERYTFYMPDDDYYIKATYKKIPSQSKVGDVLRIISIRDVRWKDYFVRPDHTETGRFISVPTGASSDTILVSRADKEILYGYAVEFSMRTSGIKYNNNPELIIKPKIYRYTESGRFVSLESKFPLDKVSSKNSDDIEKYLISCEKEGTVTETKGGYSYSYDNIKWSWLYYLPLDMYEEIKNDSSFGNNDDIVLEFEIYVMVSGKKFDYIKTINHLNESDWNGKMFMYEMDHNLLYDIYDNANN